MNKLIKASSSKVTILVTGVLILYLLSWNLVIKKTYEKCKYLKSNLIKNDTLITVDPNFKFTDEKSVNENKDKNFIKDEISPEYIFNKFLNYCNTVKNIELVSAPNVHESSIGQVAIFTNLIELKGEYYDLLKLIEMIESNNDYGFLSSIKYYRKQVSGNNTEELYVKLTLQVFKLNKK